MGRTGGIGKKEKGGIEKERCFSSTLKVKRGKGHLRWLKSFGSVFVGRSCEFHIY